MGGIVLDLVVAVIARSERDEAIQIANEDWIASLRSQ
jgi:hypothetical protein